MVYEYVKLCLQNSPATFHHYRDSIDYRDKMLLNYRDKIVVNYRDIGFSITTQDAN